MSKLSKQKGAAGEREVVGFLRAWWASFEPTAEFARTPGSGGWQGRGVRGQSLRGEMRMGGDVMTSSVTFPFSVEVKRCEDWSERVLCMGKPSPVWGWWLQCQKAAGECGLVPMLWFRRSREQWRVMLPYTFARRVPIRPPFMAWTPKQLLGVDVGGYLPIVFGQPQLRDVDPMRVVELARNGDWLPCLRMRSRRVA